MNPLEQVVLENEINDLAENIIKQYAKYNVTIGIDIQLPLGDKFVFLIKTKRNTQEAHVQKNADEVHRKLNLPVFIVEKYDFNLYLIVSRKKISYESLFELLTNPRYRKAWQQKELPYAVGHSVLGDIVIADLATIRHLLLGGSTGSGKSIGLQALITSIASSTSPSKVNFILIDVGANDLMPFEGIPHLSCPIVQNRANAEYVLTTLAAEMEHRIALERDSPAEFNRLPRLVLVIDEFPALFMGAGKNMSKEFTNILSSLLQRGRHAKIHLVLAAQNPTFHNMKIDLGI